MRITIIGTGYVGLVTGVSLADSGHIVTCVGRNKSKIDRINKGESPFFEPGLDNLLKKLLKRNLISATDSLSDSIKSSDCTLIAVGTPTVNNKIDLSEIEEVSRQVGEVLRSLMRYHVVVVKSTVVPGTTENVVLSLLERYSSKKVGKDFGLCMSPEFLREGNALEDALKPDRIVIGQFDVESGLKFAKVYKEVDCSIIFTNLKTAELTKYASNALFATLISYSNEIARIAEKVGGIDVLDVWNGVHLDKRLSPMIGKSRIKPEILSYILSGCGYGGSCFPKDTKALANFAKSLDIDTKIIDSVIEINDTQPYRMILLLKESLKDLKNKKIAVLGLSFKPNTDDLRESPAIKIIKLLIKDGANVVCHDPTVSKINNKTELRGLKIIIAKNVEDVLENSDAALIVTAWDQYKKLNPAIFISKMKNPVIIDGRRIYDKNVFIQDGITYQGIGFTGI